MAQQGDNQLIHDGIVIGRVQNAPDHVIVTDGSFLVNVYDAQGTVQLGDHISIYRQNSTYYCGQTLPG